jgi:pantoate--beta-alanine ligase
VITLDTIDALRTACDDARTAGRSVGLVPTMGYFHAGHRSLMHAARARTDFVVVTLFVNPTQFGPNEDLAAYPRDLDADRAAARAEGVDVLFVPAVEAVYPDGPPLTRVHVERLTEGLCGASRPVHFDGVTTVVTKLFSIVGPCTAFFGRKDFQQLAVVRRMARDLNLPVVVEGCPLVREPDGVAMSSRNEYLTDGERVAARVLSASLRAAADAAVAGERSGAALEAIVRANVGREPLVALEYAEVRDAATLEPRTELAGGVVLAVAAAVGRARLIDNVVITVDGSTVEVDLGTVVGERGTPAVP